MKRLSGLCAVLALLLLAQGCGGAQEARAASFYLGTYIELRSHAPGAQGALDAAMDEIARVDAAMDYAKDGDVGAVNAGAGAYVAVGEDTFELIGAALYINEISGGAYNPLVLPALRLWGLQHGEGEQRVPDAAALAAVMPLLDVSRVTMDAAARAVRIWEGMELDLGGITKGYAGERACGALEERGVSDALLALGGNIVAMGRRADRQPYRIGIRHPRAEGGGLITLEAADKAVVTSGDYEHYFISGGQRYHHILDPATGAPARSGLISVTIIADSSTLADGLSTAVFVMGAEKGLALIDSMEGTEAVLVDEDGGVYATAGVRTLITIHDPAYALK